MRIAGPIIKIILLVSCLLGCTNSSSASSGGPAANTIIGDWQLLTITIGGKTETENPDSPGQNMQMVFTDKQFALLGARRMIGDFPETVSYYQAGSKILVAANNNIAPMFDLISVNGQSLVLQMAEFTMTFKRITDDDVAYDTSLIKRIPKPAPPPPPPPPPPVLDSADLLKDSTGKLLTNTTQASAIQSCQSIGKHLPTARELAVDATKYKSMMLEKADLDEGNFDKIPDGYSSRDFQLVEVVNPDGKTDSFYYSDKKYERPEKSELGTRWFRSASLDKNGRPVVFYGYAGTFDVTSSDLGLGGDGIRCK